MSLHLHECKYKQRTCHYTIVQKYFSKYFCWFNILKRNRAFFFSFHLHWENKFLVMKFKRFVTNSSSKRKKPRTKKTNYNDLFCMYWHFMLKIKKNCWKGEKINWQPRKLNNCKNFLVYKKACGSVRLHTKFLQIKF